jgi:alkylation response protein AidB-like acyl-CoA dehydrogenase
MEMLGPEGTLIDDRLDTGVDWQQRFLYAPAIRIAGGSNEVQRNIMAERVLGLPGEIRTDRDVAFRDIGKVAS